MNIPNKEKISNAYNLDNYALEMGDSREFSLHPSLLLKSDLNL